MMRSTHNHASSFLSFTSFLSSPGDGRRTFCERWQFIVDDDVDKKNDVNDKKVRRVSSSFLSSGKTTTAFGRRRPKVVFTNEEEFTLEKRKAERQSLCCREKTLLPPLAYRTPARRFRRADGERRGEEDEGDATARRWCRGKRTLSFEMSRRRSLVQKSSRRGRRATTGSSSKPPSSFSTSETTTTTTTTSFFLSEPEDEDEENDIYYYGPRTSSSARLAAVVEKYKTFLESKNMRLPRWLL